MEAVEHDESSGGANLAFRASQRFAIKIGAFDAIQRLQELRAQVEQTFAELTRSAGDNVAAWRKYLDVDGLHSDGCMRAAFATVSEGRESFGKVYEFASQHPTVLTEDQLAELEQVLEHFDDILESLALLIDDEARHELRDVLVEAGIDAHALEREDAKTDE